MRRISLIVVTAVLVGMLSACNGGTPRLEAGYQPPEEIQSAFDSALAYVREKYPDQAPAADLEWKGANVTPDGLVGSVTYQFEAGDFSVEINHGVVAPEDLVYYVGIDNVKGGDFHWAGSVTPDGVVTEVPMPEE